MLDFLQEVQQDGEGSRAHPSHFHPSPILQQEYWDGRWSTVPTHPTPIHPTFSGWSVRWRWGTVSISPMFSRRYTRMEGGPMPTHPTSILLPIHPGGMLRCWDVLREVHRDGEGSCAHPSPVHPSHVLCVECWDGGGVPCSPIPLPSFPSSPGRMLGWRRRGSTSACPVFSRKDAGNDTGHHIYSSQVLQENTSHVLHSHTLQG